MVIILFYTGLSKTIFFTYSFGKLVFFCLSAFFVFSACSEFNKISINLCNICIIIIYIVGVRYSVLLFSLIIFRLNNLWEQIQVTKTRLELLIKKQHPGSLWVLKIPFIKKNVEHLQNERVQKKRYQQFFWKKLRSRRFIFNLWY